MKSLRLFFCVLLAIGLVIVHRSSLSQDGWYSAPNTPITEDQAREDCLDEVPPTCAYLCISGEVVETLFFRL